MYINMSYNARIKATQRRAGGLFGYDRGWLPGSSQASAIGIPYNLVYKTRERTTTLVTREAAANIAGGTLTKPLPTDFGTNNILIDTRSLVVNTNQLSGVGRFRSQYNVDADGIKYARYYLPIYPENYFKKVIAGCSTCEKPRPDSVIQLGNPSTSLTWTWTLRGPQQMWISITSSSDGTKLAAVVYNGNIWTSVDLGVTWTEDTSVGSTKDWRSITMSSDGTKLAAVVYNGNIWGSLDSGATWTQMGGPGVSTWTAIAMSADGTKLAACDEAHIWISNDSGNTWTNAFTLMPFNSNFQKITMSSNGEVLAAAAVGGFIWISNDSGNNWTSSFLLPFPLQIWTSIAMSSDGTKLAACSQSPYGPGTPFIGNIWTSSDSGQTWTKGPFSDQNSFRAITISGNGMKLAVIEISDPYSITAKGHLWLSTDSGVTWTKQPSISPQVINWISITSSSDGTKLAAAAVSDGTILTPGTVVKGGNIWTGVYA